MRWRTGRHRSVIWKSLVLPAAGAALCWLLLMTLWLPVLDYARSYTAVVKGVLRAMDKPGCIEGWGLTRSQIAALARSRAARRAAAQQPGHLCVAAVAHGVVSP